MVFEQYHSGKSAAGAAGHRRWINTADYSTFGEGKSLFYEFFNLEFFSGIYLESSGII